MTETEIRAVFEAFSRGEISRKEVERRLDREVSFADALLRLREYRLPLPRPRSDPDSVGVRLIRDLAARNVHAR